MTDIDAARLKVRVFHTDGSIEEGYAIRTGETMPWKGRRLEVWESRGVRCGFVKSVEIVEEVR